MDFFWDGGKDFLIREKKIMRRTLMTNFFFFLNKRIYYVQADLHSFFVQVETIPVFLKFQFSILNRERKTSIHARITLISSKKITIPVENVGFLAPP